MAQFKKGQSGNPNGKPKGAISEKTKFWNELKEFMANEGAEKFKTELMKLEGSAFVTAFNNSLEYFQPKLNRTTLENDKDNPVNMAPIIHILPLNDPNKPKPETV